MKPLAAVCRGRGATLLLAFVCFPLVSCLELESTTCRSGLTCPSGMMCAVDDDICIKDSPSCGDGIVQASVGEECDDGNLRPGDDCSGACKFEVCGNGTVDKEKGEACDRGDTIDGDGCSADCRSTEKCGNGIVDRAVGEVCDYGDAIDGDGCSANCRSNEMCGNRVVDASVGEICDDGDAEGGDGCSADCRSGEGCGDGILDKLEQCDDGNPNNDDACVNLAGRCVFARCGDGFTRLQDPAEVCDDAGESKTCDSDCTLPSCGDGVVNFHAGEQCDPKAPNSSARTCNSSDCSISRCGDGIVNPAAEEECDDGPLNGMGACLGSCKVNRCGNGTVEEDREVCDDGNNLACGRCSATCSESQLAKATGRINVVWGPDIDDRETFAISDGENLPIIFEFNKDNHVDGTHVPVTLPTLASAEKVAEVIAGAINNPGGFSLNITATPRKKGNEVYVDLVHDKTGTYANQRIVEGVSDSGFTVTGMSGGQGNDCPANVRCTNNNDCLPGLSCDQGICQ